MAPPERGREGPAEVAASPAPSAPRSARLALACLVGLALLAPWALGGVTPWGVDVMTTASLATALAVASHQAWHGGLWLPRAPLGTVAVLLGLGLLQLVPLPRAVHALAAPGSAGVWHPSVPEAAALLGDVWRPISIDPEATHAWLGLTGGLVAVALLAVPALEQRSRMMRTAWAVVAAGSVLAVYAIVARAALGSLLYGRIAVPTVAPFGPFVNKNHFAGYVEMAAVLAIGLGRGLSRQAAGAREGSSSWASSLSLAAFAAAAGMGMAVLLSLSRGGVLGLVSGLAVFAILDLATSRRPHPIGRVLVPVGMAALLVALAVALPGEVHDRLLGTRRDDRSAVFRMDTWREAFRAWTASPIAGQGMGAFADTLPRYKTTAGAFRVEHPENEPLEMAVEGGLIGLGAVAFALSAALVRATSGIRGDRDRVLRGVVAGGIAGACGLLVHGLVDFNLRIPSNAALFLVLVALAMAPLGSVVQVGAHRRWFLAALAACAVAAWWRPAPSSSLLEQAKALAAKAAAPHEGTGLRLSQADRAAREYVARRPADPEGWLLAAWTADRAGRREEASALARHAITLDPERPGLRDAVRSLNAH